MQAKRVKKLEIIEMIAKSMCSEYLFHAEEFNNQNFFPTTWFAASAFSIWKQLKEKLINGKF